VFVGDVRPLGRQSRSDRRDAKESLGRGLDGFLGNGGSEEVERASQRAETRWESLKINNK